MTFGAPSDSFARSWRGLSALAAACAVLSCGAEPLAPPQAALVRIVAGHGVTAVVGTVINVAVRVEDATGHGMGNISVGWAVTSGDGSVGSATATTNAAGEALTTWVLGTTPGPNTLTATVSGLSPVMLTATATVGAPASVAVVSGDHQSAAPGAELPSPIVVRVRDLHGNGVPGVPVQFSSLGGTFEPPVTLTNPTGEASARWRLGLSPGPVAAVAGLQGPSQGIRVDLSATAVLPPDPPPNTPLIGQLAVGSRYACVIQADGATACWGDDASAGGGGGALGRGVRLPQFSGRVRVAVDPGFTSIHSRGGHTCARTAAGETYCWGRNNNGESRGDGTRYAFPPIPENPLAPAKWSHGPYVQVSPALLTTCVLAAGGVASCWGINQRGEVGDGTTSTRLTPVPVSTGLRFISIEASWVHTCGLITGGAAHCWGMWRGQLDGRSDLTPVALPGGLSFAALYSGAAYTCGITLISETWCWGDNAAGQLGDGTTTNRVVPVRVNTQRRFVMVAPSTAVTVALFNYRNHTCALDDSARVYCWGANDRGQLGDGTTVDRMVPTPVLSNETFVAVAAGDVFTCALTPDRRAFCWGDNTYAQLGSGAAGGMSPIPVLVP